MSRFVSAGTNDDEPTERDEAWLKAQQQIEAAQTQQKPRPGEQEGGKSLYETLQANKAAKQEAFEENARLSNQFRSLDDDEVEFLDTVLESERAKEAEVKKATRDQLDAFRRQQEDAEKAARSQDTQGDGDGAVGAQTWTAGPRKRKKGREGVLGGLKVRRTSTAEKKQDGISSAGFADASSATSGASKVASKAAVSLSPGTDVESASKPALPAKSEVATPHSPPTPPKPASTGLGLAAYSSDEDE